MLNNGIGEVFMRKNNIKKMLVLGCVIGFVLTGCGNQTANTQQTGDTQEIHTSTKGSTGEQKQETETQELTSKETETEMESLEETTISEASTGEVDVPSVSETSTPETDAQTTEAVNSQASESVPNPEFEEAEIEF